jgi:predicted AlkP superfamily phosphohydrolase/phosphomutase
MRHTSIRLWKTLPGWLTVAAASLCATVVPSCGGNTGGDTTPAAEVRYDDLDTYLVGGDWKRAKPNKLVFIGIDGASWSFVNRLIEQGQLPNLERAKREGAFADLRSVSCYMSPPAWVTMMTGALPHKTGVYTFGKPANGDYFFVDVNAEDVALPSVWDIASHAGKRVAAINVPVTYPVCALNGIMISGMLTPTQFAPPLQATETRSGFEDRVPLDPDLQGVGPVLKFAFGDARNTFLVALYDTKDDGAREMDKIHLTVESVTRGEQSTERTGAWTFDVGVYSPWMPVRAMRDGQLVDAWCKIRFDKGPRGYESTLSPTMYRIEAPYMFPPTLEDEMLDQYGFYLPSLLMPEDVIASVVEDSGDQATMLYGNDDWDLFLRVFTESDHIHHVRGFGKPTRDIYHRLDRIIGRIMEAMPGDATLIVASDHGFATYEYGIDLNRFLNARGLLQYNSDESIDFENTIVYHNLWHLYFNPALMTPEALAAAGVKVADYDNSRTALIAHLEAIVATIESDGRAFPIELRALDPGSAGEPPDMEVLGTYDNYGVQFWNLKEPYPTAVKSLKGTSDRWWHKRTGMFLAWGASIAPGVDAGIKNIEDVTPTLLYLMDLPVADYIDGTIMFDIVDAATRAQKNPRRVTDYAQIEKTFLEEDVEREELEKKLRSLGYIK